MDDRRGERTLPGSLRRRAATIHSRDPISQSHDLLGHGVQAVDIIPHQGRDCSSGRTTCAAPALAALTAPARPCATA